MVLKEVRNIEKVEITTIEVERVLHSFYCDECNKHLGTSEEYDDGWYQDFGQFKLNCYIDGWYSVKKCLCENCKPKFIDDFKTILKNVGFTRERE